MFWLWILINIHWNNFVTDNYYFTFLSVYAAISETDFYHNYLQRVFDQLSELPPDEPVRFEYNPSRQPKDSTLKQRVHRKYKRFVFPSYILCVKVGTITMGHVNLIWFGFNQFLYCYEDVALFHSGSY